MRRPVSKWTWTLALLVGAASTTLGCVGGSKGTSKDDLEKLKPYILDAVPSDIPNKLDINFENKVHLVGYKVDPAKAAPGSDVKITMYWRCDDKVDDGWSLFTHILDSNNERILNIDNVGPLREVKESHQALWPSAWEKGKVYVDEQSFRVPDDVKTADIAITTGIWKGDARLKVVGGAGDAENRGIVVRLKTGAEATKPAAAPHTELPRLRVNKLAKSEKINIDGKLDDEAWKAAATTPPFVDVGTGSPNTSFPVNGTAKLAWDDTSLYIGFQVEDPDVIGGFPKDAKDPHLWTKDTVEIMLDPDGDGDNNDYYEIQVNPQNLVFDTQYDTYNAPKTEPDGPFGHQDWSAKMKTAVVVDGTMDKPGDKDKGYTVEVAIPWSSFTKAKNHPPKGGDEWRMNFYAMKNNSGVSWSPILGQGNFHKASRFGRVLWATADMPAPAASGSALGAASAPPSMASAAALARGRAEMGAAMGRPMARPAGSGGSKP